MRLCVIHICCVRMWSCLPEKHLCLLCLGQGQWAEVLCHCDPSPEGPMHARAHLGSSQRMGKTAYSQQGGLCRGLLPIDGRAWGPYLWLVGQLLQFLPWVG